MGLNLFNIKEDPARPSPREIYNWRVYVLAIAASWGSAAFGYGPSVSICPSPVRNSSYAIDSAFIGGTLGLTSFKNDFGIDSTSSTGLQARIVSTCTSHHTLTITHLTLLNISSIALFCLPSSPSWMLLRCHLDLFFQRTLWP